MLVKHMYDLLGLSGVDLSPWNWDFWDILLGLLYWDCVDILLGLFYWDCGDILMGLFYWDCAAILLGSGSGPFVSPIEDAIAAHGATFSFVVSYYSLKIQISLR